MSHIAAVKLQVKDLGALAAACEGLGLEFMEGQTKFKYFYGSAEGMNDKNKESGFDPTQYGQVMHVIRVKNADKQTYEVGVVPNMDGQGYSLVYDNFLGGYGLEEKIGVGAQTLKQHYGVAVATKAARKQGFTVRPKWTQDGNCKLVCTR
jgi:hypothetical protein